MLTRDAQFLYDVIASTCDVIQFLYDVIASKALDPNGNAVTRENAGPASGVSNNNTI